MFYFYSLFLLFGHQEILVKFSNNLGFGFENNSEMHSLTECAWSTGISIY